VDAQILDAQACDFFNRYIVMPGHQKTSVVSVSPAVLDDLPVPVAWDGHIFKPLTVTVVEAMLHRLAVEKEAPVDRILVIGPVCSGPMILLADDNDINLQTYSDYLRIKGFQVVTASSGPEALQLFQTIQPDLTLMDIQMPGMDGLKVMQSIRTLENPAKRKPIIALTALAMAGDRERCLAAGADEYLSKPISLHELVYTIQTLIQENRRS
jgi:CheY-like chemotaxis protein